MRNLAWIAVLIIFSLAACSGREENVPAPSAPTDEEQAVSLLGESLYPSPPAAEMVQKYKKAKAEYEMNPDDPDTLIWYGRRTAYLGKYKDAIKIYTQGIEKFPQDARIYRHRGHRYISTRKFDRAIEDFEHAARLVEGKEDEIEPDGIPNARNIPVSTLQGNIWYHLGLTYYLKNDMRNALRAYRKSIHVSQNSDMLAATTHWLYMTLRRLKRDEQARQSLEPIHAEMEIIENMAYHQLCLFYKGEIPAESLMGRGSIHCHYERCHGLWAGKLVFLQWRPGKSQRDFSEPVEKKELGLLWLHSGGSGFCPRV
jgi:tetratricopeptide (TPR) repeat protein